MTSAALPALARHRRPFLHRRQGHRHILDAVVLKCAEATLAANLKRLGIKADVKLVCMALSSTLLAGPQTFLDARADAGRSYVIRFLYHFPACRLEIDPAGSKNRGLLSLMRRHRHNLKPNSSPG